LLPFTALGLTAVSGRLLPLAAGKNFNLGFATGGVTTSWAPTEMNTLIVSGRENGRCE
jgi:hypothetical protein